MRLAKEQKWQATLRWLRRNFPVEYRVEVQSSIQIKDCGDTTYSESSKSFKIRVRKSQSLTSKIDTIIHEWAHVVTWFGFESEKEDHSGEHGMAQSKIYRTFLLWNYGRAQKKKWAVNPLPGQREFDF